MDNNNLNNVQPGGSVPGKGKAIASLVLGIISIVLWWGSSALIPAIISIVLGIVGLVLASSAKKDGFEGGIRKAGFILSLIGTIGGAIFLVSCAACVACVGAAASSAAGSAELNDFLNSIQ